MILSENYHKQIPVRHFKEQNLGALRTKKFKITKIYPMFLKLRFSYCILHYATLYVLLCFLSLFNYRITWAWHLFNEFPCLNLFTDLLHLYSGDWISRIIWKINVFYFYRSNHISYLHNWHKISCLIKERAQNNSCYTQTTLNIFAENTLNYLILHLNLFVIKCHLIEI